MHSGIKMTSYKAMFSREPRVGLSEHYVKWQNLFEEDLEEVILNISSEQSHLSEDREIKTGNLKLGYMNTEIESEELNNLNNIDEKRWTLWGEKN